MALHKKAILLHLSFRSPAEKSDAESQIARLEALLNDGWQILHSIPMGAAGGMTGVSSMPGGPLEKAMFAEWTAVVVLQKEQP